MALTGNKGEWSEIYVLLKLLGDGVVFAGDQHLERIKDLFYPIVMILREEEESTNYLRRKRNVVIQTPSGRTLHKICVSTFLREAESLLSVVNGESGTFAVPKTESFMTRIRCRTLKAKSSDKTDIRIILHDRRTKMNSEMGFSIKSQLGGNSTLLNAGHTTNFNFRIEGGKFTQATIDTINGIDTKTKVIDRIREIRNYGGKLSFDDVDNRTFRNNLIMLDGDMPRIIGELLLAQIDSGELSLRQLTEDLTQKNPLGYDLSGSSPIYEYKLKHLLTTIALGMMPGTPWNGKFEANGGYLVVKEDGEILCYHFYDRNRFEDYLFSNAYLERASTTRHQYGFIETINNNLIFKLNLQIRLK